MSNGLSSIGRKTYPIAPLLRIIRGIWPHLSESYGKKEPYEQMSYVIKEIIGVHERTFDRWVASGRLREEHADRIACRLGYHPYLIWGDLWFNGYRGCELEEYVDG